MKPYLPVLLVCLFACGAFYANASQAHLYAQFAEKGPSDMPHQHAVQVLFNLPTIVTGFLEYQAPEHVLVQLYQYFLDERLFRNLMHDFFRFIDSDGSGIISSEEHIAAMNLAGIDPAKTKRAFTLASIDNPSRELGFLDFCVASEILFDESIAAVTFAYLVGNPSSSQSVGVDRVTLVNGLSAIFSRLPGNYPRPGCDQLEYLFLEFDRDCDNKLNSKEFFHVISIFLRYYKAGMDNNAYATQIVQRDDVFTLLWEKQKAAASETARLLLLDVNLDDLFQMAVFEKILSSVANNLFQIIDENKNGVIDLDEFKKVISYFNAPEKEALLLYTLADTDESGSLDFGEFLVALETFVRKSLSYYGFNYIKATGRDVDVTVCSELWRGLATKFDVDIGLTDEAFQALYNAIDVDHNTLLDLDEFGQFTSIMVTSIKKKLREDLDVKISVSTAINATQSNINEAYQADIESGSVNTNVSVSQGIVARILSRASIATSQFASTTITVQNGITISTQEDEFVVEGSAYMDNAMSPGAGGFGFSLFDAVKQATQTNAKDHLDTGYGANIQGPSGLQVLLQGQLKNLPKYEF